MSDDQNQQQEANQQDKSNAQEARREFQTKFEDLPEDTQQNIRDLRSENKRMRLEFEKLQSVLNQQNEQRLADQNEWKALAEKRAEELAEANEYKKKWKAQEETISEKNKRRVELLAAEDRKLVPQYDDPFKLQDWLNDAEVRFKRPAVPALDAGAGGITPPSTLRLTPSEAQMARNMGMSEADYLKQKIEIQQRRNSTE